MFRIGLLLIVIACIALGVTNPGEEAHKKIVCDTLSSKAGMEGLLGEVTSDVLGHLDVVPLKYNNYLLFSTTTFRDDTMSVGLFTRVWATDWSGIEKKVSVSIR